MRWRGRPGRLHAGFSKPADPRCGEGVALITTSLAQQNVFERRISGVPAEFERPPMPASFSAWYTPSLAPGRLRRCAHYRLWRNESARPNCVSILHKSLHRKGCRGQKQEGASCGGARRANGCQALRCTRGGAWNALRNLWIALALEGGSPWPSGPLLRLLQSRAATRDARRSRFPHNIQDLTPWRLHAGQAAVEGVGSLQRLWRNESRGSRPNCVSILALHKSA